MVSTNVFPDHLYFEKSDLPADKKDSFFATVGAYGLKPHKTRGHREKSKQRNTSSETDRTVSHTTTKKEFGTSWSSNVRQMYYHITSDQLNFIVGSKSINENTMDINLGKLVINQKKKEKIKAATAKTNIHILLNILKTFYANTHQDSPRATSNEGAEKLQLAIDTRQALSKRPPHINRDLSEPHTSLTPSEKRHSKRPSSHHAPSQTAHTRPLGAAPTLNNRTPVPEEGQNRCPKTVRQHTTNSHLP
jgi:hypothetical protein